MYISVFGLKSNTAVPYESIFFTIKAASKLCNIATDGFVSATSCAGLAKGQLISECL